MTRSFRLAVHSDAVAWGGAEVQLATLLAGLPEHVRVTVLGGDPAVVRRLADARPGAAAIVVPTPTTVADLSRLRALRNAFARLRCDAVHVNLTWTGGNRGGLVAALAAAPGRVVAVDHLPGPVPTAAGRWLARRLSRRVRAYVTVGQRAARTAERTLDLPTRAVVAIRNATPGSSGERVARPPGHRTALGTVCRLEPQKGVDVLLAALAEVPGTELLVVGAGSQRKRLGDLVLELGLRDRVRFTGPVADVGARLREMDVFVSASRSDGLPLAVLEAMHAGLPVVATDVGSVGEAVAHGSTGLLVPPDDIEALAAALRKVSGDPEAAAAMGRAGRRRATAEFAVPCMVDAYLRVYGASPTGGACRLESVARRVAASGRRSLPALPPMAVADLELSRPLLTQASVHPETALLVRLHGEPLGFVRLRTAGRPASPQDVADAVWTALSDRIREHRAADAAPVPASLDARGLPDGPAPCRTPPPLPPATVVVATRDRPRQLARCLRAILAGDHPDFSVVVVDNGTDPEGIQRLAAGLADPRLRVVVQPRRGTSIARNTGVRHAATPVVAFTDDDTAADPQWLSSLAAALERDPSAAAVTGLTVPLELETPAQLWFERFGGLGRGLRPFTVDRSARAGLPLLFPYSVGALGAGANLAVRRAAFDEIGGLREGLGPGTATFGGEDLDLLSRLLLAGHRIAYAPRAVVRHEHRRDDDAVRLQAFTYGAGLTAQLAQHLADPAFLRLLVRSAPGVLRRLAASRPPPEATPDTPAGGLPAQLRVREFLGYLYGPLGLEHAAWHGRHRDGGTW